MVFGGTKAGCVYFHGSANAGHTGTSQTYGPIHGKYWWPFKMLNDMLRAASRVDSDDLDEVLSRTPSWQTPMLGAHHARSAPVHPQRNSFGIHIQRRSSGIRGKTFNQLRPAI
eukprot:Blabericola_migrator_1__7008@NODE_3552_length_1686_cov_2_355158_g2205_i0_p1_GENE_NODE_3552_length_1686_cov_2_355158_g2205_i0NODE_3552_length_1686_cov_2_355158_g2205_i0_p1_ORF_typecomplete_len113_score1_13Integrase_H2C2/PF17921_1/0_0042_NODE_3552_length_1686_cov_2_355158_g2205_i0330668